VAGIFFGIWLLLALAIADFPPPPPGFWVLVLILLACALLVYLRIPAYFRWWAEGAKGRVLRVARDGLLGGGAAALLSLLSPVGPSIQPGLSESAYRPAWASSMHWQLTPSAHGYADDKAVEQRSLFTYSTEKSDAQSMHVSAFG